MNKIGFYFCACLMIGQHMTAGTLSTTYKSYNPKNGQQDLKQNITYQLPDPADFGPGPYPVFIWTPGYVEWYGDPQSLTFVMQMAKRGFIAASVQYSNYNVIQVCGSYLDRAQGVYDAARSTSAVSVLCALPTAGGCVKGVVTAGISEGAALSVLAKNFAPKVAASYAMSVSDFNMSGSVNLASCLDKSTTAIPSNRLMIVNGESDPLFGGQEPLEKVSGYFCPTGATQCWSPDGNGAGWYIIKDSQVTDGDADHCYQMIGSCTGTSFDTRWYPPTSNDWSLAPNLNWLASLGTRRSFSTSGQ